MRANLRDPALASQAGRFVWLELNYDEPRNAAFLDKHLNQGFPFLFVVDPRSDDVLMTWSGGATPAQLVRLLEGALAPARGGAEAALRRGEGRFGKNDLAGAQAAYEEALALGGKGWARHDHAVEQLVSVLQVKDPHACTVKAAGEAPGMERGHPFVNVALLGLACAYSDPEAGPDSDLGKRVEALALQALDAPAATEDDRYLLFESLTAARQRAGDAAGLRAVAERYLATVEAAPSAADDDRRLARDLARLRAALKLGAPERAIPSLEASERAVAHDANPSLWLATAYLAAGRLDDTVAACTRGLTRAPSATISARLLQTRAGALAKKGDAAAARRDLEAALDAARRIPVADARAGTEAQLRKKIAELK